MLHTLKMQGCKNAEVARKLGRHRSTIGRELQSVIAASVGIVLTKLRSPDPRQAIRSLADDGISPTNNCSLAIRLLREEWSPQRSLGLVQASSDIFQSVTRPYTGISGTTTSSAAPYSRSICDRRKNDRRKRYGSGDSRGVMRGKRHITERPPGAENRSRIGHWEIDTVIGSHDGHCIDDPR